MTYYHSHCYDDAMSNTIPDAKPRPAAPNPPTPPIGVPAVAPAVAPTVVPTVVPVVAPLPSETRNQAYRTFL